MWRLAIKTDLALFKLQPCTIKMSKQASLLNFFETTTEPLPKTFKRPATPPPCKKRKVGRPRKATSEAVVDLTSSCSSTGCPPTDSCPAVHAMHMQSHSPSETEGKVMVKRFNYLLPPYFKGEERKEDSQADQLSSEDGDTYKSKLYLIYTYKMYLCILVEPQIRKKYAPHQKKRVARYARFHGVRATARKFSMHHKNIE